MRYSPSTNGFYPEDIDYGKSLPDDVIDITQELYQSLLQGQSDGKIITPDDKKDPYLAESPEPTQEELISIADTQKNTLIDAGTQKIIIWQTKLLMGRKLSDADTASLNSWMDYIDAVSAIDSSTAPDIAWPSMPS